MADPYLRFAQSPIGGKLAGALGLPRPPVLLRYRAGQPSLKGGFVLGSAGKGPLLSAVLEVLASMKVQVLSHGEAPDWIAQANQAGLMVGRFSSMESKNSGQKSGALVFDASNIEDSTQFDVLYNFFMTLSAPWRNVPASSSSAAHRKCVTTRAGRPRNAHWKG